MPAGAGTPRYESGGTPGVATCANERSVLGWGQAPALQPPLPTPLDSGFRRNDEWGAGAAIPDRSPGHAFIAIAHAGLPPAHQGMKMWPRAESVYNPLPHPSWIPASAGMTNGGPGCFHSNRACRLVPAHQGMKVGCGSVFPSSGSLTPPHSSWIPAFAGTNGGRIQRDEFSRSCGLVQRIGGVGPARPHPDPSGGQAPALHFLIPRSTMGLRLGRIRRWRAGMTIFADVPVTRTHYGKRLSSRQLNIE